MIRLLHLSILIAFAASSAFANQDGRISLESFKKKPKLVVVVVIDQCRSDFLTRFANRMASQKSGGLSYFMKQGAYFPFAKYDILQSMTCPGHATILTGAYPSQMGIPLNEWYDASKKSDVYCAEDASSAIVGRNAKPEEGMSPRRLLQSTVGDELKIAGYKSKVVSIALKDRAAIMMGGHRADLALWSEDGKWVSSKFYLPQGELPSWVRNLNAALEKEKGSVFKWKIAGTHSGLTQSNSASTTEAASGPAPLLLQTVAGSKDSFSTEYGVEITTAAAIRALKEMKLGQSKGPGTGPDILAISYSSHDMLGHDHGLQSDLMEELTLFEDESIGKLIGEIEKSVGLKNVLFAFTGDHGVAPAVSVIEKQNMPAGNLDTPSLLKEANMELEKKFGKSAKGAWVLRAKSYNFYLDPEVVLDQKKSRRDVEA